MGKGVGKSTATEIKKEQTKTSQGKQNLRTTSLKDKLEFNFFLSPAARTKECYQQIGLHYFLAPFFQFLLQFIQSLDCMCSDYHRS